MDIELVAVAAEDKPVLAHLIQLYLHDFSEFEALELSMHGTFDYPWLDHYFTSHDREAYLITVDGRPAGFALTRHDVEADPDAWNLAEFFVVRRHRHRGVGREAARRLFRARPGTWTLSYLDHNGPAARLWSTVLDTIAEGRVTYTHNDPPSVPAPVSHVRFRVGGRRESRAGEPPQRRSGPGER